jgi:hypothetical protein
VWEQPSDVQMGFHGFQISWSPAELQAARSGAARPLGQQVLRAGVPGGWTRAHLQAVMAALIPDLDIWQAVLPQLVPDSSDERSMLRQLAKALTAPWPDTPRQHHR